MLKNDAVSVSRCGFSQVKPGVLKLKLFRMQEVIQISKKSLTPNVEISQKSF